MPTDIMLFCPSCRSFVDGEYRMTLRQDPYFGIDFDEYFICERCAGSCEEIAVQVEKRYPVPEWEELPF